MSKIAIIIPSRLSAKRLLNKPLKVINKKEMILHVYDVAIKANIGEVFVATPDEEIIKVVQKYGGKAVITKNEHKTGTDRIFEVFEKELKKKPEFIINLQGDMPTISPKTINSLLDYKLLVNSDIYTLATEIINNEEKHDPNVVKVVISKAYKNSFGKALYFSRSPVPYGKGPLYHHIGIYGYTRESLERFVKLKPSELELRESLEQLRAMEANMDVHVGIIDEIPIGVDNLADFKKACEYIKKNKD